MTAFVESCVETVQGSASAVERRTRGRPRGAKLLKLLAAKRNILVTTHLHPDPDALASAGGLAYLLREKLEPATRVDVCMKGQLAGGINEAFADLSQIALAPWDDRRLAGYDAIILTDVQPPFAYNPLPEGVSPIAVIDHHRAQGRKTVAPFCDIRTDVGATSSMVFSYFAELDVTIPPRLAATLLYAIESDLAGAAGTPGELDNIALSNLTLLADTQLLYRMRYVRLSASYYAALAEGITSALIYGPAVIGRLESIDTLEKPAVIADALLRYDKAQWSMVTAPHDGRLVVSLRTCQDQIAAADMIVKMLRGLGQGGGHRMKAGGYVPLETGSDAEIERIRTKLRQRFLRAVGVPDKSRGVKLVPGRV